MHFAFAASETFNEKNQGTTVEDSLQSAERIVARAHEDGIRATVTIGTSFGCPFEGAVDPGACARDRRARSAAAGADEIVFADTVGVGVPRQVRQLVAEGVKLGTPIGVHLHNTRSPASRTPTRRSRPGRRVLDASVGGIGGCPFAPRATGNIATEDLVYLLHGEGIETGIDLDALIGVAQWLEGVLGRTLEGQVYRAGSFAPVARLMLTQDVRLQRRLEAQAARQETAARRGHGAARSARRRALPRARRSGSGGHRGGDAGAQASAPCASDTSRRSRLPRRRPTPGWRSPPRFPHAR